MVVARRGQCQDAIVSHAQHGDEAAYVLEAPVVASPVELLTIGAGSIPCIQRRPELIERYMEEAIKPLFSGFFLKQVKPTRILNAPHQAKGLYFRDVATMRLGDDQWA